MKHQFLAFMKSLSTHSNTKENVLIGEIFPGSTLHEHLVYKLERSIRNGGFYMGLLWFYENLDLEHTAMFDKWLDEQIQVYYQRNPSKAPVYMVAYVSHSALDEDNTGTDYVEVYTREVGDSYTNAKELYGNLVKRDDVSSVSMGIIVESTHYQ
jgi:hypothetical protein